jgi:hypothetical protein
MIHDANIVQHAGNTWMLISKSDFVYLESLFVAFLSKLEMIKSLVVAAFDELLMQLCEGEIVVKHIKQ